MLLKTQSEVITDAIAGVEANRSVLGDSVADATLAVLRERLAGLEVSRTPTTVADEQSLRQVTVLFADVVDSTRLSQRLDPEDIQAVIDGALSRFRDVVESHGGRALQYAGDSMLAAFGIETAGEDDAERAIRAGLGILEQSRLHSDLVRTRHADLMFELRVGIHTGTVLLGGGVDGEHTIRGMTVNIAARMEQTAPVGGLRITHATFAQVRGVFDVTEEAPLLVKGHDGPIGSYLVHRAKPRAFRSTTRGIEGVETRMIGREVELEKLQAAFKGLLSERKPVFVTVVAEAGVGKSRLLYEFQNWAELRPERYLFFQGRAFAKSQVQPYALIRDVFAWRLQIGEGEAIASARAKLEQEIVPLFVGSDGEEVALSHAHLLGHLIGLDFSESRTSEAFSRTAGKSETAAFMQRRKPFADLRFATTFHSSYCSRICIGPMKDRWSSLRTCDRSCATCRSWYWARHGRRSWNASRIGHARWTRTASNSCRSTRASAGSSPVNY